MESPLRAVITDVYLHVRKSLNCFTPNLTKYGIINFGASIWTIINQWLLNI